MALTIPEDVIFEIASFLSSPADILSLSLTSSQIRHSLRWMLYASIDLNTNHICKATLELLDQHPEIARFVKSLAVRPNQRNWAKYERLLPDAWVMQMIERVSCKLTSLHTFIWGGSDMASDAMWTALRNSCPQLQNIASTVIESSLMPGSEFFAFSNLTGFSLTITIGLRYSAFVPMHLPLRMWDMLSNRCPHLRDLSISISQICRGKFDLSPLTRCQWPHLRGLTLDGDWHQSDVIDLLSVTSQQARDGLESLSVPTSQLLSLCSNTPAGAMELALLRHLKIRCDGYLDNSAELCNAFWRLPSLQSLSMTLRIDKARIGKSKLSDLFTSCSHVSHLELFIYGLIDDTDLAIMLRILTRLESLILITDNHFKTVRSMLDGAIAIFQHCPSLRHLKLKRGIWWSAPEVISVEHVGTYALTLDDNARPDSLSVRERSVRPVSNFSINSSILEYESGLFSHWYTYPFPRYR